MEKIPGFGFQRDRDPAGLAAVNASHESHGIPTISIVSTTQEDIGLARCGWPTGTRNHCGFMYDRR
jgi:hypothetical protein